MAIKILLPIFLLIHYSTSNILIPCENSGECNQIVPTSFCQFLINNSGYCACPAQFTFNSDASKCLREATINGVCEDHNQCSHMLHAGCNEINRCECLEGFTYFKGQCRKFVDLHEPCDDDIDCQFSYFPGSAECTEGFCECADGFYERYDNLCRIKSSTGEPCVVNSDCIDDNTSCTRLPNDDMFCLPTSRRGNYLNFDRTVVDPTRTLKLLENDDEMEFGAFCENEKEPCEGLKYSVCKRGLCQCQPGFFLSSGRCMAELGMTVDSKDECSNDGTVIFNNKNLCSCENDFFAFRNMRYCTRSIVGGIVGSAGCTQQSQCSPYGVAFCLPGTQPGCRCFDYAIYNPDTELCELKTGLTKYCGNSTDCEGIPDSICQANRCICQENYVDIDGVCRPSHGALCQDDSNCAINDSKCAEFENIYKNGTIKICQCKMDFVATTSGICRKIVETDEDICEENEQCFELRGTKSTCVEEVCGCHDEGLHLRSGNCFEKKYVGEQCMTSFNCDFGNDEEDATECRNGFCQCRVGKFDEETQKCHRKSDNNSSGRTISTGIFIILSVAVIKLL